MTYDFTAPAQSSDLWRPADSVGHLLVIAPTGIETEVQTSYGMSDAVRADVHDITGLATWTQTLIFSGTLVGALRPRIGSRVLTRLDQGAAKPGKSAPYILTDMSGDQTAVRDATAYLDSLARGVFQPPAEPAAPAQAQAPSGAPVQPNLQDPAIQAALAALAASGLQPARPPATPPF